MSLFINNMCNEFQNIKYDALFGLTTGAGLGLITIGGSMGIVAFGGAIAGMAIPGILSGMSSNAKNIDFQKIFSGQQKASWEARSF